MADAIKAQNLPTRKPPLTQARLKELLNYDPQTGVFRWLASKARRVSNGDIAGGPTKTRKVYWIINVDYRPSKAHRLAWLYVHGWLPDEVDHRDNDGLNNRIDNLRPCTPQQNRYNTKKSSRNSSGFKGVSWHTGAARYRATIHADCKRIHLGYFDDPELAHAAYREAAARYHGEFARFE